MVKILSGIFHRLRQLYKEEGGAIPRAGVEYDLGLL